MGGGVTVILDVPLFMVCVALRTPTNFATNNFSIYQDLPCTLNWGFVVPNSGYLGPNRG